MSDISYKTLMSLIQIYKRNNDRNKFKKCLILLLKKNDCRITVFKRKIKL